MRSFKPGERFELPNGEIVSVRVVLLHQPSDRVPAYPMYHVTPAGVLATPCHGLLTDGNGYRVGCTTLELSALDVEDLRPIQ